MAGVPNWFRNARAEEIRPASRTALRPAVPVAKKTGTPRKGRATAMVAQTLVLRLSVVYMEAMTRPKRSMSETSRRDRVVRALGATEVGWRLSLRRITSQLSVAAFRDSSTPRMPIRKALKRVAAAMPPARESHWEDRFIVDGAG